MAAAGLATMGLGTTYTHVLVGQLIFAVGTGMFSPGIYALAAITGSESQRAQNLGLGKTGIYGGPLIGQLAMEPVVGRVAAEGVLLLICGFAIILAVREAWIAYNRRVVVA